MTSTEQLEREAEMSRQQLLGTVEELRARLTPRQMVNQVLDYVGDGDGAEFARNFKNQVVANPLPATLMSAGLAWLMLAGKRPARADYTADAAHRRMHDVRDEASDMVAGASEAGQSIAEGAGTAAVSVKNAAASTLGAATEAYEDIASRATKVLRRPQTLLATLVRTPRATTRSVTDFCRDQPLVLAGLGIAIGAALGALLPGTEAEDSLMGEAADEVKDEMQQTATETTTRPRLWLRAQSMRPPMRLPIRGSSVQPVPPPPIKAPRWFLTIPRMKLRLPPHPDPHRRLFSTHEDPSGASPLRRPT